MKSSKILMLLCFALSISTYGQSAEEIIDNYLETTGGVENWKKLEGIKFIGKGVQQGQEFPGYMVMLKDGRQVQAYELQGRTMKDNVFDGETLWSTNFQNMKAEKASSEETNNFKLDANDFPDPFIGYKEKGYTVELLGKEIFDGVETNKVKLAKEPHTVDGQQVDDIVYYYFDAENNVPIAMEVELKSGPGKGQMFRTTMSDYQEVEGFYFPFTTTESVGGQEIITISLDAVELNPEVEDSLFAFPEEPK